MNRAGRRGKEENEIRFDADMEEEQEQFDYILTPSFRGYFFASVMPCFVFFLPTIVFLVAPELFRAAGIEYPLTGAIALGGVLTFLNLIIQEVRRRSCKLKLNIDYLVHKRGIFFTSIDKVYFTDIKNIRVVKSLTERILGIGRIDIATAGTGSYEVVVHGYARPERIMKYIAIHRKEGE